MQINNIHNLKDKLTFLIACKIEHPDRLRNTRLTLSYLKHYFNADIILCEHDSKRKLDKVAEEFDCIYIFNETEEFFNKCKGFNLAARKATTPVIALYDADIILRPQQIVGATEAIANGQAQMAYPYNGKFYDVPEKYHTDIANNKSLKGVNVEECILFNPNSVGGAVLIDREHYWKCGGANENFKSVGFDDNEIDARFKKLGTKIMRTEWPLFHLTHSRRDTSFNHNPYIYHNQKIYVDVVTSTPEQLAADIDTWTWHK